MNALAFCRDGQRLASASEDKTVKMWDLATAKETLTLKQHPAGVSGMALSPDGTRLVTASMNTMTKIRDTTTGEEV